MPTHILVRKNYFLKYDSIILLEQIRTIDKSRLVAYKGSLKQNVLDEINFGLIEAEEIDFISYLKSLGIGGNNEKKKKLYSDYYSEKL